MNFQLNHFSCHSLLTDTRKFHQLCVWNLTPQDLPLIPTCSSSTWNFKTMGEKKKTMTKLIIKKLNNCCIEDHGKLLVKMIAWWNHSLCLLVSYNKSFLKLMVLKYIAIGVINCFILLFVFALYLSWFIWNLQVHRMLTGATGKKQQQQRRELVTRAIRVQVKKQALILLGDKEHKQPFTLLKFSVPFSIKERCIRMHWRPPFLL